MQLPKKWRDQSSNCEERAEFMDGVVTQPNLTVPEYHLWGEYSEWVGKRLQYKSKLVIKFLNKYLKDWEESVLNYEHCV